MLIIMDRTGAEVDANRTKRQKDINQNPIENSNCCTTYNFFLYFFIINFNFSQQTNKQIHEKSEGGRTRR